jgi:YidC/Oxa1 family membrane protein insertase
VAWVATRVTRSARPPESASAAGPAPDMTRGLARLLPFTTLVVAAFMPLATGLYLLTTTAWTVAERAIIARIVRPPGGDGAAGSA